MKRFQQFIEAGIVKKKNPNKIRAVSLLKEAEEKKRHLELSLKMIPKNEISPNFIVDYCYDIIMELIRGKMLIDGYSAGNSHEAEIYYMLELGFAEAEANFMDEIRYYRNGTKYYGTILGRKYSDEVLAFLEKNYFKLKKIIGDDK
jgi:hypothetical protein